MVDTLVEPETKVFPKESEEKKPDNDHASKLAEAQLFKRKEQDEKGKSEDEVLRKADGDELQLRRVLLKRRYENIGEKPLAREELQKIIAEVRSQPEIVVSSLRGWDIAYSRFLHLWHTDPGSFDTEYWDGKACDFDETLSTLLTYGLDKRRLEDFSPLNQEESEFLDQGGLGLVREMLSDKTFEARTELINYLNHYLWKSWKTMNVVALGPAGEIGLAFQRARSEYEKKRGIILPLYQEVIEVAALSGRTEELGVIFEGLDNIGAEDEADQLVTMEGLSDETRLRVAVEYINKLGFIRAVDLIAGKVKDESISEELRTQLKTLYGKIQGDEAKEIAAQLSEIYEKIDFTKYKINKDELTRKEVDDIEQAIDGLQVVRVREGKDKKQAKILDVGAGTGRHSLNLRKRGYTDVTAFEDEQKHVEFMRQQDPEMRVIRGDWSRLTETVYPEVRWYWETKQTDFALSLGRTIAHNRTPTDMFHFFDEIQRILDFSGRFMFDLPDIEWGVYQKRADKLKENLKVIGVEPMQSEVIFDGPNDINRFNRMVLRPEQVKATAALLGYKLIDTRHQFIGQEGEIKNLYYLFEVDGNFDPSRISRDEVWENLKVLGLLDPGTDFDLFIDSWGMTLGQALLYGLEDESIRRLNDRGRGPKVFVEYDGSKISLDAITPAPDQADWSVRGFALDN